MSGMVPLVVGAVDVQRVASDEGRRVPDRRRRHRQPAAVNTLMAGRDGIVDGMITTIDKGGRVVVPKAMRDALGLRAGSEVEVEIDLDARSIAIAPKPVAKRLVGPPGQRVVVADETIPPLTVEQLREILERVRDRELY